MSHSSLRPAVVAALVAALASGASAWAADASPSTSRTSSTPARSGSSARMLPDPALLDGSALAADKKNEQGMLGEFEIPGDDNAPRNGRVGGPQNANSQGGLPSPMGQMGGMPGGSAGGQQGGQQGRQGGAAGAQASAGGGPQQAGAGGSQQGGSEQGGGPAGQQNGQRGGTAAGTSTAESNGQAEGMQVAGISGETDTKEVGKISNKPQAVAIGDPTMAIKTVPNSGAVGGTVTSAGTMQVETRPGGSAGGQPTSGNNSNRGSERGRAMPAGL